jgi:hypothetical protein
LLAVDEIDHSWQSTPENLKFEFRYKFMPKGILARLIVKLNADIFEDKYWRYGVILHYDNTMAIIREKYFENKVTIELFGNHKREYLFTIRKALKEIHKDFNKIKVDEMIPCNCSICKTIESPSFYEFDYLQRLEINNIIETRCPLSLENVKVYDLTCDIVKSGVTEKIIICENQNAQLLASLNLNNVLFYPERDSQSVFIKVRTKVDMFGLRDRDYLVDIEIEKLKKKYPNYFILNYYCFENYLFHPDNIEELNLSDFNKNEYISDIIKQKNEKKNHIISNYKLARKNYQEFKIESENIFDKHNEDKIIDYIESNDLEIFFKSFSMKDHYNKTIISKYMLKPSELAKTKWFKKKKKKIILIE